MSEPLTPRLDAALAARLELEPAIAAGGAVRLFNGFVEGFPGLVIDRYAGTAVVHDHLGVSDAILEAARERLVRLPGLRTIVVKPRRAADPELRRGRVIFGDTPDRRVREHGVAYALDLLLNQDASFYVDTRELRRWAIEHLAGARVLNTFAYTGSLGVAAAAGGAVRVVQVDKNREFLNVAKTSCSLNGFPIRKADFIAGDFWTAISALQKKGERFDCVFVDPPFFSSTRAGRVDLVSESHRVINKVRPLVAHGGALVVINNALFVSGGDQTAMLERLCADGYLTLEARIPVPADCIGYPSTRVAEEPVSPAPFNAPTKIAVLRVTRKDQQR